MGDWRGFLITWFWVSLSVASFCALSAVFVFSLPPWVRLIAMFFLVTVAITAIIQKT